MAFEVEGDSAADVKLRHLIIDVVIGLGNVLGEGDGAACIQCCLQSCPGRRCDIWIVDGELSVGIGAEGVARPVAEEVLQVAVLRVLGEGDGYRCCGHGHGGHTDVGAAGQGTDAQVVAVGHLEVIGSAAFGISADDGAARDSHHAALQHYAATSAIVIRGRVASDSAAVQVDRGAPVCVHAAAIIIGRIAADSAAIHGEGAAVFHVHAAAIITGSVTTDGAAIHGEGAADDSSRFGGRIVGLIIADDDLDIRIRSIVAGGAEHKIIRAYILRGEGEDVVVQGIGRRIDIDIDIAAGWVSD